MTAITVHGAVVTHEYGMTTFVATTEPGVTTQLFNWVREYWHEASNKPAPPESTKNKRKAIKWFFNHTHGDYDSWDYFKEELEMEPYF